MKNQLKIAEPADGPTASETLLCEVTGVSQPLRHGWITKYGLRRRPRGTYDEYDVRQLAALKAMLETLGPADGTIAWDLVSDELAQVWDERPLVLLFDVQDKEATLVSLMPDLADRLPYGHRVLAVRLDEPLYRALRAFRRATARSR